MTFSEFEKFVYHPTPPAHISPGLLALWYDAKGEWDKAHDIAQDIPGREGAIIHAYLHRKEGDKSNASYWYHKAGEELPAISLVEEWTQLVRNLTKD